MVFRRNIDTTVFLVFLTLVSAGHSVFGQQGYPGSVYVTPSGRQRSPQEVEALRRIYDTQRNIRQMDEVRRGGRPQYISDGTFGRVYISAAPPELVKKAKKHIKVEQQLVQTYASFLRTPKTGMVKILPPKACVFEDIGQKESFEKYIERCPFNFLPGRGGFFSFRKQDYVRSALADIGFADGFVYAAGDLNQAFISSLGKLPLEEVRTDHEAIKFLNEFRPAETAEKAAEQMKGFENGVTSNGFLYERIVEAELEQTYAMRIVAYGVDAFKKSKLEPDRQVYSNLKSDSRDDLIVAFQIVQKGVDGSLTILWRELTRAASLELALPIVPTD